MDDIQRKIARKILSLIRRHFSDDEARLSLCALIETLDIAMHEPNDHDRLEIRRRATEENRHLYLVES